MKKGFFILFTLIVLSSCNMIKAPEFKGITKIDLKKNEQGETVLVAYAKFHNPNLLGGKFKISDVKVFVNDKFLANLNSKSYKVPSIKDFEIPLEVDFDTKYFNKSNILDALNSVINNQLKVQYKGKIYYVSHGLNVPYNVDYTQTLKLLK